MIDWNEIKHFRPEEFDDPAESGSWKYMDEGTIWQLEWLRRNTGWAIITHNKFGLRGTVCVLPKGHSKDSYHYIMKPEGCSAADWHFDTAADPREQIKHVLRSPFNGIGLYYDGMWNGKPLPVWFHTDRRKRFQIWKRVDGIYTYLLE